MSAQNPNQPESIDEVVNEAKQGNVGRRDFLRRAVLLGLSSAAAYKLLDTTTASAQTGNSKITTFAIGEEGSGKPTQPAPNPVPPSKPIQKPTTLALGEEDKPQIGNPTTLKVGEEGTYKPKPTTYRVGEESSSRPTTKAVGEETGQRPTTLAVGEESTPVPQPTTRAVGEESNSKPNPTTARVGEETRYTTYAVGEESSIPKPSPGPSPQPTTLAVGEETGSSKSTPWSRITTAVGEEGIRIPNRSSNRRVPSQPLKSLPRVWKNFRRW